MSTGYPVVLRLAGRRCVVVGGGSVATRKIGTLVRFGADVLVVAPEVAPEIEELVASGGVHVERRPFEPADLDGALLAFAATDQRAVNRAVVEAAEERGVLANVSDDPSASDFTNPGLVRRRDITLAVSTGGRSPAFARFLREQLQEWLTDTRCTLLDLVAEVRRDMRSAGKSIAAERWHRAIDDEQVARAIESGDREGARRRIFESLMAGR
jgi:precorrin-2 dehydrogenase / sirohydrochlorin ferrochelatase